MDILKRLRDPEYDWCDRGMNCNSPMFMEAADEIERLRQQNKLLWDAFQKVSNEIIRLTENAKQDAHYLLAYHRICQKHGIAPSSSELIEAMKEGE